jgi:hypothetical protein
LLPACQDLDRGLADLAIATAVFVLAQVRPGRICG